MAEMEAQPRTSIAVVDLSERHGYAEVLLRGYTEGGAARIAVHRPEAAEGPDALLRRIAADIIVCDLGCPQPWRVSRGADAESAWHETLRWVGGAGFEVVVVSWRDASALRELQTLLGILPKVGTHEPRLLLSGPELSANAQRDMEKILGTVPRGDFPWKWENVGWVFHSRWFALRLHGLPGDPGASGGTRAKSRPWAGLIGAVVILLLTGCALTFPGEARRLALGGWGYATRFSRTLVQR